MIRTSGCNGYNNRLSGMTLVELLIAVVIVGIISSIAYPSFTNHIIKSHRAVALSDITRLQLALETSYKSGYRWTDLISGGLCTICDSDMDRFSFSIVSSATTAYTITATAKPKHGQNQDPCFPTGVDVISITSTNIESPNSCWN